MDSRTDQEKADDLIQEYLAQLELPSADPCGEIEERLNSLREGDKKSVSGVKSGPKTQSNTKSTCKTGTNH